MSKNIEEVKEFTKKIDSIISSHVSSWTKFKKGYFCGTEGVKRNYCVEAYHTWGRGYCEWYKRYELENELRKAGATNIVGTYRWNRIELYFDISAKAYEQYTGKKYPRQNKSKN